MSSISEFDTSPREQKELAKKEWRNGVRENRPKIQQLEQERKLIKSKINQINNCRKHLAEYGLLATRYDYLKKEIKKLYDRNQDLKEQYYQAADKSLFFVLKEI